MSSHSIHRALKETVIATVKDLYGVELGDLSMESPPQPKLGDLAFTVAFDLAKRARMSPRKISEQLAPQLEHLDGVERVEVAGPGYLNVFFDRSRYLNEFYSAEIRSASDPGGSNEGKTIVEHTNINPNKAAHIGHLRNAALGDTFVRVLRYGGVPVEVQNYIDDTGVQVADVVVGFRQLENKGLEDVEALARTERFDYYCWDLYARVNGFYTADPDRKKEREKTLHAIEEGKAPEAAIAQTIATHIAQCHLTTMERIGVRYDLLPWEGDILRLRFWNHAFELLKEKGAIRLTAEGKNAGCWIMDLPEESEQETVDEKVIVRSNGTVTYVGKDIAYQMWKLGLLDSDFEYRRFRTYPDGAIAWLTSSEKPSEDETDIPQFGHGSTVYNVIDVRQSYLQRIVQQGVALIASEEARERSHHFSYEMVALTPATCRELGFPVSEEDAGKAYLEVSGRKGLGVKADDLIDVLEKKALAEVRERNPESTEEEQMSLAKTIAVGALRYFMIKYTKNKVIAFDFTEALSFKGDSGPYLQYATVRANKIIQKMGRDIFDSGLSAPTETWIREAWKTLEPEESDETWDLARSATRLKEVVEQVKRTEEPAHLAGYGFQLAQKFSAFYRSYHILNESDPTKQSLRLFVVQLFRRQMTKALELMGIPVPEKM